MKKIIQCEECNGKCIDINGFGIDELGEFTEYICEECGHVNRIYDGNR